MFVRFEFYYRIKIIITLYYKHVRRCRHRVNFLSSFLSKLTLPLKGTKVSQNTWKDFFLLTASKVSGLAMGLIAFNCGFQNDTEIHLLCSLF